MKVKKQIVLLLFFVVSVIVISFVSASYLRTSDIGSDYTGIPIEDYFPFDENKFCEPGQDFVIQIDPTGCEPAVARSDLLAEENVPIFCPLVATKLNPLVDVEAIEGLTITGEYPQEVSGVGFYPNRAALGRLGSFGGVADLNSPILNNIGYAVIVLKRQKNESALPKYVEGNLTARIRYDIKNAFGVGKSSFLLREFSEDEWEVEHIRYGFWNRKGFVRVDDIEGDTATITVFDEANRRVLTDTLSLSGRQESSRFLLSGLGCFAPANVRLEKIENPDTRARLKINGDIIELTERQDFLDGKCVLRDLEKRGLHERVEIECKEDSQTGIFGKTKFNLAKSPKIKLNVSGEVREYAVGDLVFEERDSNNKIEAYVYLGFVDEISLSGGVKKLYVHFVAKQTQDFSERDILAVEDYDSSKIRSKRLNSLEDVTNAFFAAGQEFLGYATKGRGFASLIQQDVAEPVYGESVTILGFAEPVDFKLTSDVREKYGDVARDFDKSIEEYKKSISDHNEIIESFSQAKENEFDGETLAEKAMAEKINLAIRLKQMRSAMNFCEEMEERYLNSNLIPEKCSDLTSFSNSEFSSREVLVNDKLKVIDFMEIVEPSKEEFSADVVIRGPNDDIKTVILTKGKKFFLDEFRDPSEKVYVISVNTGPISSSEILFTFSKKDGWLWRYNAINSEYKTVRDTKGILTGDARLEVLKKLDGLSFEAGRDEVLLGGYNAVDYYGPETIELISLDNDEAVVEVDLYPKGFKSNIREAFKSSPSRITLDKDISQIREDFTFELKEVRIKKFARISVIPQLDYVSSETEFKFKIGIEKRAIQLTPEQAQDAIEGLNKSIETFEKISSKIGDISEGLKASCVAFGGYLTAKNFINNFGTKGIARQKVMNDRGGWEDRCTELGYSQNELDKCFLDNADEIDKDVEKLDKILSLQNKKIEEIQEKVVKRKTLTEEVVDTDEFVKNYLDTVKKDLDKLPAEIIDEKTKEKITIEEIKKSLTYENWKNERTFTIEELRSLHLYGLLKLDDSSSTLANRELYSILTDVKIASADANRKASLQQELLGKSEISKDIGITFVKGEKSFVERYDGGITEKRLGEIGANSPIQAVFFNNQRYIAELQEIKDQEYSIKGVYDLSGNLLLNSADTSTGDKSLIPLIQQVSFKKFDETSYKNRFVDAEVKYYETEPYKGLPAIVPFHEDGWYAATKPKLPTTIPIGSALTPYAESGRINSLYLCNVGRNGIVEFSEGFGDDICELINLGTGQPYDQFYGLSEERARDLVNMAVKAIKQAQDQYPPGERVRIGNLILKVGAPAVDTSEIRCQDFASPKECQILFNLCDPVICPSSRCDLGGAYPVRDVIQSGITGSIALCLPNAKEGVYLPICLTGVKAGIDSLTSVQRAYQQCLKQSIETGESVGICDEIHSIYLCEFVWRQGLPLAKIALPKTLELVTGRNTRGGGEYISVQNAFDAAENSVEFFTDYYAVNSYDAFKYRNVEQAGTPICQNFISAVFPSAPDIIDNLAEPDSPTQFTARFDEIPLTTATVPPSSQYKVFYYIFAGNDRGAYYQVYLKGPPETSFFRDTAFIRFVASGYAARGGFATETVDFRAPSGYQQLCVRVNDQEECDFKQVTTEFGINYLTDQYVKSQIEDTNIDSAQECISGSPSAESLLTFPFNVQEGLQEVIDPAIYNRGIIRICSTHNPGEGTDAFVGGENARWVPVGHCGDENLQCWLDKESIKRSINGKGLREQAVENVNENYREFLDDEVGILSSQEFDDKIREIDETIEPEKKIEIINENINKVFFDVEKAKLIFRRAKAYENLAGIYNEKIVKALIDLGIITLVGEGQKVSLAAGLVGPLNSNLGEFEAALRKIQRDPLGDDYKDFVDELCKNRLLTSEQCGVVVSYYPDKNTVRTQIHIYLLENIRKVQEGGGSATAEIPVSTEICPAPESELLRIEDSVERLFTYIDDIAKLDGKKIPQEVEDYARSKAEDPSSFERASCFDRIDYIFKKAGLDYKCVYTDGANTNDEITSLEYVVNDKGRSAERVPIAVKRSSKPSCVYTPSSDENPSRGKSAYELKKGDVLSIGVYTKDFKDTFGESNLKASAGHNVIFVRWLDRPNGVAEVFHGFNGKYEYTKDRFILKEGNNPVVQVWRPVILGTGTTPDITPADTESNSDVSVSSSLRGSKWTLESALKKTEELIAGGKGNKKYENDEEVRVFVDELYDDNVLSLDEWGNMQISSIWPLTYLDLDTVKDLEKLLLEKRAKQLREVDREKWNVRTAIEHINKNLEKWKDVTYETNQNYRVFVDQLCDDFVLYGNQCFFVRSGNIRYYNIIGVLRFLGTNNLQGYYGETDESLKQLINNMITKLNEEQDVGLLTDDIRNTLNEINKNLENWETASYNENIDYKQFIDELCEENILQRDGNQCGIQKRTMRVTDLLRFLKSNILYGEQGASLGNEEKQSFSVLIDQMISKVIQT